MINDRRHKLGRSQVYIAAEIPDDAWIVMDCDVDDARADDVCGRVPYPSDAAASATPSANKKEPMGSK